MGYTPYGMLPGGVRDERMRDGGYLGNSIAQVAPYRAKEVIAVRGGVACLESCTPGVAVKIVGYDVAAA